MISLVFFPFCEGALKFALWSQNADCIAVDDIAAAPPRTNNKEQRRMYPSQSMQ